MAERIQLLEELNETVAELLTWFHNLKNPDQMIYELWSAQDILAHLTFWHESFARNVDDIIHDRKPNPHKGRLSDLNQQGVESMRDLTLPEVIQRMEQAHQTIQTHILNPKLILIPYRKGTQPYTPEKHLEIVIKHIQKHLGDVKRQTPK